MTSSGYFEVVTSRRTTRLHCRPEGSQDSLEEAGGFISNAHPCRHHGTPQQEVCGTHDGQHGCAYFYATHLWTDEGTTSDRVEDQRRHCGS
uniref:Uncharacterized protein n=1 Tax=Physcomitrium patens TaxID=3218 RepID=A0A2K1IXU4_PHYPA|nr:hypothetical protein PHYPA_023904 [Physcomitrium patens]